jgi:K+-transporting ATPase KdpF subunit
MTAPYLMAGIVALGLFAYLVVALLWPEALS